MVGLFRPGLLFGGGVTGLRPQDVFAAIPYSVTSQGGSVAVPFAPDFVWAKARNAAYSHYLFDVLRGNSNTLSTNNTGGEAGLSAPYARIIGNSFTDPGYDTGNTAVAWPIKRARKFFDIVTYPGDGTSGRQIPHGLGIAPGMVIIKRRDAAQSPDWFVWHRSISQTTLDQSPASVLFLSGTGAASNYPLRFNPPPTSTTFGVGNVSSGATELNASGALYVAYLFAHDPDPNGIIQCGSWTEQSGTEVVVNLGWRPQFLIWKPVSNFGDWIIVDAARGWSAQSQNTLSAQSSNLENTQTFAFPYPTNTGIQVPTYNGSGAVSVFMAIRAPIT